MSMAMSLNSQYDAATQALNRMEQDKAYTESVLSQQVAAWQALRKGGPQPLTLEEQLAQMQDQLAVLEARYTPQHPDIIKLKSDIAQLRKKIDEADLASGSQGHTAKIAGQNTPSEPSGIQRLRHEIDLLDQGIQQKKHEQERLQNQLRIYEGRVQLSPLVEEQYKKLTRDYQNAQKTYEDLLAKKTQTSIATNLDRTQGGEQLRLAEPVGIPTHPSFPDPIQFSLAGAGVGLMIGGGIALWLELRDKTLRNEKDVEFYLQLPALAVLPNLDSEDNSSSKRPFWHRTTPLSTPAARKLGV